MSGTKLNKQNGFTLIELIIVIITLAILSVVAAPRFIDISTDATVASLNGMKGALKSGSQLVFAKALVQGKSIGPNTIEDGEQVIQIHSGYPVGFWGSSVRYTIEMDNISSITTRTDVCQQDWCGLGGVSNIPSGATVTLPAKFVKIFPKGFRYNDECGVYFLNKEDGSTPEIGIEDAEC